jgi:glycosyltransferase involved in cell wall biosynthesis
MSIPAANPSRSPAAPADPAVGVAIVCNSLPPYRIHLHRRIAAEIPSIRLWTVCTHEGDDARWPSQAPEGLNFVSFHNRNGTPDRHAMDLSSFYKGGDVIAWLEAHHIRAVVVMGYNDLGRMRLINWCHENRVPVFVFGDSNIKGDNVRGLRAIVKRLVVGWVVNHVTGVFPCGSLGAAYFQKYGARPEQVYYFPYEPDYDQIQNMSQHVIEEALRRYNLPPSRRRAIFSGRFADQKRPDLAIRAFLAIAPQRPDWDLVMLGDGPMRSELQRLVPVELANRVYWTGFIGTQDVVSALYRGGDVLILPSQYEPWALVINEAAAAGMAIICSDVVGAAAELVRDGENGRLFPSGDLEAFRDALLDVTEPSNLARFKAASPLILNQWRQRGDPAAGLRRALTNAGVLCGRKND